MTDRELLELAAKAAGVKFDGSSFIRRNGYTSNVWDPLHDNDDALHLAVELKMNLTLVQRGISWDDPDVFEKQRRAIVEGAAEIGKKMPAWPVDDLAGGSDTASASRNVTPRA
ncbi:MULTISPECIES: hypothetical protein [unclassified Pseudomonas]|uniref:hypothetical protein n=1 Tax=unclassified Pseudomonas TaxID=196821 RepID=UPI0015A4552C|nr:MULTISPECIES: hypothetical protein [unclassified Pseudomonas]NWC92638.1 hypothetical protein [Pseudomonas sp. IPO3779]NWD15635.1 hypothetical protein [Pseudomonas sp. IPO3778]